MASPAPTALAALAVVVVAAVPGHAAAQAPPPSPGDTAAVTPQERAVSAAGRAESSIGASTAAVSLVSGPGLSQIPGTNLADVLRLVPGFALLDFDGLGHDPQTVVRGFYGGGADDYVLVMLDGELLNDLHGGRMSWDLLPPVALEAVEVVRGPSADLYGDGAVAAVVNLVSAREAPEGGVWELGGGELGSYRGGVRASGEIFTRPATFYASVRHTGGYREHAQRTVGSAGARVDVASGEGHRIDLVARWMLRDLHAPGPLPRSEADRDPRPSEIFYSYDGTKSWFARAGLDGDFALPAGFGLSAELSTELRRSNEIGTVQPMPEEGDTGERSADSERVFATVELERSDLGLPWPDRLVVGLDASLGRFDTEHRDVVSGGPVVYLLTDPDRPLIASGEGTRNSVAGFARYELRPVDRLRISVGARADALRDSFQPGLPRPGSEVTAEHGAFSPRAGLNLEWLDTDRLTGRLYATAARTFKAPTPDQLFDQRRVAVPPAVDAPISNPGLDPQRGTSLEAGAYHEARLPGGWTAGMSLATYRIRMEDEIEFDPRTFQYGNIAESLHRGVEAGLRLDGPSASSIFVNYTLQEATSRSGEHRGNALRAVPRHTLSAGAGHRLVRTLDAGVWVTHQGGTWLDEENTARLPSFTRVDARASYSVRNVELSLEVLNLFDRAYSTTGFLDPGGTDTVFVFPAAGRVLQLGLRLTGG